MTNEEQLEYVAKAASDSAADLLEARAIAEDVMEKRARAIAREHSCDMSRAYAIAASDPVYVKAYALSIDLGERASARARNVEAVLGSVVR